MPRICPPPSCIFLNELSVKKEEFVVKILELMAKKIELEIRNMERIDSDKSVAPHGKVLLTTAVEVDGDNCGNCSRREAEDDGSFFCGVFGDILKEGSCLVTRRCESCLRGTDLG